ncbi:MAG: hypothetical protein H6581_06480 [Bacteroidia bacterium]|nr:hypothetical protein [Bacteroidia bacterium]
MNAIIIRFDFHDPNPIKSSDLIGLLRQTYGGAVSLIAQGTIFLDTYDSPEVVYSLIGDLFTFDDKLFVGELGEYQSLHHITRVAPSMRRVAI